MCHAPQHVAYAATVSCAEGAQIESGAVCSAACQPGYVASTATLQCDRGQLAPSQFACAEESCAAPWNVSFSAQPCLEGSTLAPGGICTTQCESGYTPSESTLSCSRGRLTPSAFLCAESACPSPDVMHAISPSCSGLASVKSRETCIPQCQDGYAASEELLYCNRGRLDPEVFVCEPGFPVDVGVVIASVPSALLAGSLALITAYCFMGKTAEEEKPAPYDPLQEWWQCVQEVEPGTCVFCGKQPEELETRYEDHGPATLFRSCAACAALLGFEEADEEQEAEAQEEQEEVSETVDNKKHTSESSGEKNSVQEAQKLPRPPLPRPSDLSGSISDAVKGLQLDILSKEPGLTSEQNLDLTESDVPPQSNSSGREDGSRTSRRQEDSDRRSGAVDLGRRSSAGGSSTDVPSPSRPSRAPMEPVREDLEYRSPGGFGGRESEPSPRMTRSDRERSDRDRSGTGRRPRRSTARHEERDRPKERLLDDLPRDGREDRRSTRASEVRQDSGHRPSRRYDVGQSREDFAPRGSRVSATAPREPWRESDEDAQDVAPSRPRRSTQQERHRTLSNPGSDRWDEPARDRHSRASRQRPF